MSKNPNKINFEEEDIKEFIKKCNCWNPSPIKKEKGSINFACNWFKKYKLINCKMSYQYSIL